MKKEEIKSCLTLVKGSYPEFFKGMVKEEGLSILTAWSVMLEDKDADTVMEAVKSLIGKSETPPNVHQVLAEIGKRKEGVVALELPEAWRLACRAYSNGSSAKMEFDRLPPLLQKVVGSPAHIRYIGMGTRKCLEKEYERFVAAYKAATENNIA